MSLLRICPKLTVPPSSSTESGSHESDTYGCTRTKNYRSHWSFLQRGVHVNNCTPGEIDMPGGRAQRSDSWGINQRTYGARPKWQWGGLLKHDLRRQTPKSARCLYAAVVKNRVWQGTARLTDLVEVSRGDVGPSPEPPHASIGLEVAVVEVHRRAHGVLDGGTKVTVTSRPADGVWG